jgi:hypothetical protein
MTPATKENADESESARRDVAEAEATLCGPRQRGPHEDDRGTLRTVWLQPQHAIKLLGAKAGWGGDPTIRKGRPPIYGPEVAEVFWKISKVAEYPCDKRLAQMRRLWLPHYEARYGRLEKALKAKVLAISAAQIDRLLSPRKASAAIRGRCGTKPGGLLKTQIPIRTDNWDITGPGFLEADTVAHCGESLEGDFVWSVTYTDIWSGWTVNRAVWNKGAKGIVDATRDVEAALPFTLLGFDSDNGGEFLNWHLVRYFQKRAMPVGLTRSRPYHKDDNGHVEEKNWTHVRQLFGYGRFEDPALVAEMNRLYQEVWEPLHNYFLPSMKLIAKDRHGAKIKRRHDLPQTPCDRLLACASIPKKTKQRLKRERALLDPFELHQRLEEGLGRVLQRALHSSRPTGSLRCAPVGAKLQTTSVS